MLRGIVGVSQLLIVGVMIGLIIAGCGGDWETRAGQTTRVAVPAGEASRPAAPAGQESLIQHWGATPLAGGECPTGYDIKGLVMPGQLERVYVMPGEPAPDPATVVRCFASTEDAAGASYHPFQ
jgi:hypothetical protein